MILNSAATAPFYDLTGRKYEDVVVLGFAGRNSQSSVFWDCQCLRCGSKSIKQSTSKGIRKPHCHNCIKTGFILRSLEKDPDFLMDGYLTGLVATDGYLIPGDKKIELDLHVMDHKVLETFSASLTEAQVNITYPQKNQSRCIVYAPRFYAKMLSRGIGHRKSWSMSLFNLPESSSWRLHFLRGVIDGDGYVTGNSLSSALISITSVASGFASNLKEMFPSASLTTVGTTSAGNLIYRVSWYSSSAVELARTLPLNGSYMERKSRSLALLARCMTMSEKKGSRGNETRSCRKEQEAQEECSSTSL